MRHLLDERSLRDGMASYYAFYHPDNRTQLITHPEQTARADSYIALSRTAIDLFRPLLTLRLTNDVQASADFIHATLAPEASVLISAPAEYGSLLEALFHIDTAEHLEIMRLDPNRFKPIVNVLVAESTGINGLPRYLIRARNDNNQVIAYSGINWQTPTFAEISVHTAPGYRRQGYGRSVVAATTQSILNSGRRPLYVVSKDNEASRQLAERVGYVGTGEEQLFLHATLRSRP